MYYGSVDVLKSMLGMDTRTYILRSDEFWAVEDVSFELKKGQTLGLIGPNGSGKSTLLRLLNGIYLPDKGRIEIRGRVGALISLGAGFHPLMTGRENIYLNGSIMGMSRYEINKKFDSIVDFAEIGKFLDTPVKNYSSGMYIRLGFAIAIHAEPDIFFIDEVLAVGDANFQKKCFDKILNLREQGTSIVFVSHAMSTVERLCTESILMKNGKQIFYGNTRECVQKYFHEFSQDNLLKSPETITAGLGDVIFSNIFVYQEGCDKNNPNIEFGKNIIIEFDYKFTKKKSDKNQVRIGIRTFEGRDVQKLFFQESPFIDNVVYTNEKIISLKQSGTIQFRILNPRLFPQTFRLDIAITPMNKDIHLCALSNAATFNIQHPYTEKRYLEYGNLSVTEFDYDVNVY